MAREQRAGCAREFGNQSAKISELNAEVYREIKPELLMLRKKIFGNGTIGIETRLDRLEQAALSRKQGWVIIGGLVANLAKEIIPQLF